MANGIMTPATQAALLMKTSRSDIAGAAARVKQQAGSVENLEKIEAAAKDFEAVFLTEMLKPMFEGVEPNEMFGGGKSEEIFQGLMLDEYGKLMAKAGGVGLAEHVKAEMIRIQEEANHDNR